MKNLRRYLTQDISLSRIQNVFDLQIEDRIIAILHEPGYDELKVSFPFIFLYNFRACLSNVIFIIV